MEGGFHPDIFRHCKPEKKILLTSQFMRLFCGKTSCLKYSEPESSLSLVIYPFCKSLQSWQYDMDKTTIRGVGGGGSVVVAALAVVASVWWTAACLLAIHGTFRSNFACWCAEKAGQHRVVPYTTTSPSWKGSLCCCLWPLTTGLPAKLKVSLVFLQLLVVMQMLGCRPDGTLNLHCRP